MEKETRIWIEGCRKGARNAQLKLYERYARMLFATCLRILANTEEAEEAMQDSFLKIFTHLEQYHEEMSFEGWIRQIAVRTAIDRLRQRSEELELPTRQPARPARGGGRGTALHRRADQTGDGEAAGGLSGGALALPVRGLRHGGDRPDPARETSQRTQPISPRET